MEKITTKKGNVYNFLRIDNDVNGNPRYVISWLDLGLEKYKATKTTKKAGLRIYRGKKFGGGFVLTSYSLDHEAILFEGLGLKN